MLSVYNPWSLLIAVVKWQERVITFKSVTNICVSCNIAQYNIYNNTNKVYNVTDNVTDSKLHYIWICPIIMAICQQITVLRDEAI